MSKKNIEKPLSRSDLTGIIEDLVGLHRTSEKKTPSTNNQPGTESRKPKDNSSLLD